MGTKYIIEVEDKPFELLSGDGFTSEKLFRVKGFNSLVFDWNGLNRLTPYTEPDIERVRIEAYEDGYKTAKVQCNIQAEKDLREVGERHYQKGLSDAWEAARKLWEIDISTLHKFFYKETRMDCYMYYTATEVIEKLKANKQEKEEIKVWDEVINKGNFRGVVTSIDIEDEDDVMLTIFCQDGIWIKAHAQFWKKTGRTFLELAKVLEKMRNESNEQIDT